jgi:hypothetical protein
MSSTITLPMSLGAADTGGAQPADVMGSRCRLTRHDEFGKGYLLPTGATRACRPVAPVASDGFSSVLPLDSKRVTGRVMGASWARHDSDDALEATDGGWL